MLEHINYLTSIHKYIYIEEDGILKTYDKKYTHR